MPIVSREILIDNVLVPTKAASLVALDPEAADIFADWEADLQKPPRVYASDDPMVLALAHELTAQALLKSFASADNC